MNELVERAEKIAAQAGNSLGSDCIRELIAALRETEIRRRVAHLLGESTASERDALAEKLREAEDLRKFEVDAAWQFAEERCNAACDRISAENATLSTRLVAFERTLEDCPPQFEEIFQRHIESLLA